MGSSDSGGGAGTGTVDSSIGSIVWVRRRNGSWWPGKILGADELSASHLMSPRSGTPVKLLGREDASVDWYNLEKSKRVKAFRCGEFDDCIERAEASLGLPAKKREKYARREDAILHALELEKELLEKKYGRVGGNSSTKNNSCGSATKDLCTSSGALGNGNGKHEINELQQFNKKAVSPIEDECNSNPLSAQKGKGSGWQSSINSEINPRIRGLQDFALPKKIVSVASSPSYKALGEDQAQAVSAGGVCSSSDVDSGNSMDKGKALFDGPIEESTMKRRDRRRPLVQVMQSSAKWSGRSLQPDNDIFSMSEGNQAEEDVRAKRHRLSYLPSQTTDLVDSKGDSHSKMEKLPSHLGVGSHSHPDAFVEDATSGSSEDTESDSSETDSMEHNMNVEMTTFSDVNTPMALQSRALNRLEIQGDHRNTSSEESDESLPHNAPHFHRQNPVSLDMGVSRWQLKGKRNVRNFSRRSLEKFTYGEHVEPRYFIQRPTHNLSYYHDHDSYNNDVDFIEDDVEPHIEGCGSREYMCKPQAASRRQNLPASGMIDWEELTGGNRSFRRYWGERFGGFNSLYGRLHGQEMLFDVDLKVQANHQGEHVPWVSLMSRLNGKPIVGHPIQIETLGDGSTDALLCLADFESFECGNDGNGVQPAWTTARRTANIRVPRPHLSSQLDDVDEQHVDQDQKSQSRKSVSGSSYAKKKNSARRNSPLVPKPALLQKKKPPKRSSLSSSQKIRPLSSIGRDQKLVHQPRNNSLIDYMDGMIKPLDSGPPTVACIPVKLAFSRLLEAIGRPPSMPTSHKGFSEQQ